VSIQNAANRLRLLKYEVFEYPEKYGSLNFILNQTTKVPYPYTSLFNALTNWLANQENRQQELIDLIAELTPANSLHDKLAPDADWSPMTEMDPFTFLTYFCGTETERT